MKTALQVRPAPRLSRLLEGLAPVPPEADRDIADLALDSRQLCPGGLFLACRGGRGHGLAFAEEARGRGASALAAEPDESWSAVAMAALAARLRLPIVPVAGLRRQASLVADRFFGQPSATLEVTGVTGTNGKTSVTHFLAQALAEEKTPCAVLGTLGNGFPDHLESTTHTTPDPVSLHRELARLRDQGAAAVAMEVSSHALDQGRAEAVRFRHAVFTNLTRDHLDYHGDMAAYAAAKRTLFRQPGLRWAVVNLDDPLAAAILGDLEPGTWAAGYSLSPDRPIPPRCRLWVRARALRPTAGGLELELTGSLGEGRLESPLLGRFHAANLLAVLAVLLARGLALEPALQALARVRGVPGRMEAFGGGEAPLVVVDYAHTPDALEQALTHLRTHTTGRLLCVFGCGGERDTGKRPLMGAVAERLSDRIILTDDNPRGEESAAILAQIRAGMTRPAAARLEPQRALAIRHAIHQAGPGDVVLVAGKGHESVQEIGPQRRPFSDRDQVRQALAEDFGRAAP